MRQTFSLQYHPRPLPSAMHWVGMSDAVGVEVV
jgi:hypothetical protein